ncbi:sulfonate dioxygenase SCDLUD_000016 [Saccharomycodes ludwigii]|uniref:sulfonate dioxygenase n=1 Tax=Saccharomycodes ludwigii TaxID=36035 RepID=UPI001E84E2B1|nr:hypothetical protein SCDLUD_000016 [Saccharomycodes ludwigii]KAH3902439.1 hypothetical protein SCDLUD_000016 [Saccharomycodes ludwigii]
MAYNPVTFGYFDTHFIAGQDEVSADGLLRVNKKYRDASKYPDFLPTWDPNEKYPPIEFHKYEDPALRANPKFPNLFPKGVEHYTSKITPKLGAEIRGIQLTDLNDKAKDELALFTAQRGVVVFIDQDFIEKGPVCATEYVKHFGKLHIHQTSGRPESTPYLHIAFRRPDHSEFERVFKDSNSSIRWHTDVSYELQPPSYTFFGQVEGPDSGGDTLFADSIEAYNRLSPKFQKFLNGLHVVHSSREQAASSKKQGGIQRRESVGYVHPLVRVHPVLKQKSLFVNRSFSRRIVELKKAESDLVLDFLYNLIDNTHDLQLRARWAPGSVAIWDNRRAHHSAVIDWEEPVSRHNFRVTPHGERPVEDLKFLNDETYYPDLA